MSHGGLGGNRCAGKPAAMGTRDLVLVEDFPRSWQPVPEGQTWWGLFLAPGGPGAIM